MTKNYFLCIGMMFLSIFSCFSQTTDNSSITYPELIQSYRALVANYDKCDLISFGETDSGEPLHLFLINSDGEFYPEAIQKKSILLVQNGIHAGEPCGIDASLAWATKMLQTDSIPENVVIAIIPVYNIGGMKNRGCCSRANQNGPEQHGFRGNARNLDLNRDYIKGDSKNFLAFARMFHWLKPHLMVDTHTSNGADYPYVMTLLTTRKERLDAHLSGFLVSKLEPYLYANCEPLSPYVYLWGTTLNSGLKAFNDLPRFSTGYAALFNCIGFTTEAHMWKSFAQRRDYTAKFLKVLTQFADDNSKEMVANKKICDAENPKPFESLNLRLDTTLFDSINFLSYQASYFHSEITGMDQLFYNREKPVEIRIPYYNYFEKVDQVQVPKYYVIRSAWKEVVTLLRANQIQLIPIENDTTINGVGMYIESYESRKSPFEGHYLHKNVKVKDSVISMPFYAGDYLVSTQQTGWKYILNVLEPKSDDSFFAWNFYDEILQQKEWYSAYVFEPYAQKMLEEDVLLKMRYDHKISSDAEFAAHGKARLYWLYKQSPFYEPGHNRLPVLKIME